MKTDMELVHDAMEVFTHCRPWFQGGRRQMTAELGRTAKHIDCAGRKNNKGKTTKSGMHILPASEPAHEDAITAMRQSIPVQPEVKTEELMGNYRKVMNMRKALRRALSRG